MNLGLFDVLNKDLTDEASELALVELAATTFHGQAKACFRLGHLFVIGVELPVYEMAGVKQFFHLVYWNHHWYQLCALKYAQQESWEMDLINKYGDTRKLFIRHKPLTWVILRDEVTRCVEVLDATHHSTFLAAELMLRTLLDLYGV